MRKKTDQQSDCQAGGSCGQVLDDIPEKLGAANFSDGQKMVMLKRGHPNSIHLAIKDAVDQKGAGLYDFMMELTGD